jgi:nitrate reductase NapE component
VTFAVLVVLMWIALAVIAVGLVNVAKWMVQTSTRHAVADGGPDDTRTIERPITRLEPTTPRR